MLPAATPDRQPWSSRVHQTGGRAGDPRDSFEIDQDRIVHSETFRALQHKTQVQSEVWAHDDSRSATGFRTRLNHVLEVARLARGLANEIGASTTLAEAIALAHDLGHPPFGHAGERGLDAAVREHSGDEWNANVHSLAVIDDIEAVFMAFRGIDATWAVREGVARHSTPFDIPIAIGEFSEAPQSGLESQIVDAADVLAYLSHDLDDALAGSFLDIESLAGVSAELAGMCVEAERRWSSAGREIWPAEEHQRLVRRWLIATLTFRTIADFREETLARISAAGINEPDAVRWLDERLVAPSETYASQTLEVLSLLTKTYYRSSMIGAADKRAEELIRKLCAAILREPERIPERFKSHSNEVAAVAAYIASLTDADALALGARLDLVNA